MNWLLLNSGKCPAAFNMAMDEALLESASRLGRPVLRLYGWTEPAATFGYSQKYTEVERATFLRPLIRRPTGGGIVPHDADWTYSLAFPPGNEWHSLKAEESYRRIHAWIQSAFALLKIETELAPVAKKTAPGQCFAGHEKSDLLWHGKKIAGAAQRRNKLGLLIQGSVQPLIQKSEVRSQKPERADWDDAMREAGRSKFGIGWADYEPDRTLTELAETLVRQKYSQAEFITKR
jgi:lipoate-protein ligase A